MSLSAHARRDRARGRSGLARSQRRWSGGLLFGLVAVVAAAVTQCTGGSLTLRRVDLKVLVLNDGSPGVTAIRDELKLEGVAINDVTLTGHAEITAASLSSSSGTNPVTQRANYQSVVVPNENLASFLNANEITALNAFQKDFGVRRVIASTWANPAVGLNYAQNPGYIGALDNMTGTITPAGLASPFNYLTGSVPFETGSYGYLGTPLATLPTGATFTPLVTMPIPNAAGANGVLAGVYNDGTVENLVLPWTYNALQLQFRLLARGIVNWMTKGVHLGYDRSYLSIHVDDVFAADERWNSSLNCTPGEDCPAGTPEGTPIRMTPADVTAVVQWQQANNFTFDMVFNGLGSVEHQVNGVDQLLSSFKSNVSKFRWINHTYSHQFLGCLQDYSTIPWKCQTDANGQIKYLDQASIQNEINQNKTFATQNGLPINATELVTGEHSGLYILPQQPQDNPNLGPAFTNTGIKVTGADASRQFDPRTVGSAQTLPRYPLSVFFNVAKKAEEIDEYNWIFTSAANGGSGLCTANPATMTCLTPINATTGFEDWIIPQDTIIGMRHMLGNDPRPHYVHQSNLSEDRILLTLTSALLNKYRSLFATNTPLVEPTMTQASAVLSQQAAWAAGSGQVDAYTLGNEVYVSGGTYKGAVPITVPTGTKVGSATGANFGESYAGQLSAWTAQPASGPIKLVMPTAP